MDRTSFLKAQPFLYPLEAPVTWPPPLPAETADRSSCRRETLLQDDFLLSIESLPDSSSENATSLSQQSTILSGGPAFFIRKVASSAKDLATAAPAAPPSTETNDNFDPSMCALQVAVHSATVTLPPLSPHGESLPASFSNRFTSPAAYKKLWRQQNAENPRLKDMPAPQVQESAIYLKIEGHIYQLDLTHIENVELHGEGESSEPSLPPSLLIQFGKVCILRIFSMKDHPNAGSDSWTLTRLKKFQSLLVRLLTADDQVPSAFPLLYPSLASPAGSSVTAFSSTNEPGQREFPRNTPINSSSVISTKPQEEGSELQHVTNQNSSQQSALSTGTERGQSSSELQGTRVSSGKTATSTHQNTDGVAMTRKRLSALTQTRCDVDLLEQVLLSAQTEKDPKKLRLVREQTVQLISSLPNHFASSCGPQIQVEEMAQYQNDRMYGYQVQMEELVQSFWSGSRKGARPQPALDQRPAPPTEECVANASALLEQYKTAVKEKLEIVLLPNQG